MNLFERIKNYQPYNEQEEKDHVMMDFMNKNPDCLLRSNTTAHNKIRTDW